MTHHFPFTPVLRLREQKEQAEERGLAAINADLQQVRAAIARVEGEISRFASARDKITFGVITAAHHQILALQWRSLNDALAQLTDRLRLLENKRAEQGNRLLRAREHRETLSELLEQHVERTRIAAQKSESKRIDDIFSARYAHFIGEKVSSGE